MDPLNKTSHKKINLEICHFTSGCEKAKVVLFINRYTQEGEGCIKQDPLLENFQKF